MTQIVFVLGFFEVDDLIHHTLGVAVGYEMIRNLNRKNYICLNAQMKNIILNSMFLMLILIEIRV